MYPVSSEYTSAVQATSRDMSNISVTVGGQTYSRSAVRGLTLHECVSENSDRLLPGCAACASLETTVVGTLPASVLGTELYAYHTIGSETVPLGVFIVQEMNSHPGTNLTSLVCYDRMCLYDGADFVLARGEDYITDPANAWVTFGYLLHSIVPLDNSGEIKWASIPYFDDNYRVNRPLSELHSYNCKELLGYIAGASGKIARFNRNGDLEFVWYTPTNLTIPRKAMYMGGLTLRSAVDNPDVITLYSNDEVETSGYGVYTNDLITTSYAVNHRTIATSSCSPGTLKYRGDPSIQAGDVVTVELRNGETRQFAISDHVLYFAGGLHGEAESHGLEWNVFHQLNATQREIARLKKVYANLMPEEEEEATTE